MPHVQEHPGRDEPHRPAGVRIDVTGAVGLVSRRVSAVELHDGIPALAELLLVRNVREQCITVTKARIVASHVAILHGRGQRRARIHLVRPGKVGSPQRQMEQASASGETDRAAMIVAAASVQRRMRSPVSCGMCLAT